MNPDTPLLEDHQIQSVMSITARLKAVRAALGGHIKKDGLNKHFKYPFVSEAGLAEKVVPAMHDEGLILTPSIKEGSLQAIPGLGNDGKQLGLVFVVDYTLATTDGHVWPFPLSAVAQGQDIGDKAAYKASTGGHKYMALRLLWLATGDDPESDGSVDKSNAKGKGEAEGSRGEIKNWPIPEAPLVPWLKTHGIYAKIFAAADAAGLDTTDAQQKFKPLKDYCDKVGAIRSDDLRGKDAKPLLSFLASYGDKEDDDSQAEAEANARLDEEEPVL